METKKIHAKHTPFKTQLETKHQTTQICRMKQHLNTTEVVFIKGVKVT